MAGNRNDRAKHFLITYNNPTHTAEQLIEFFVSKNWRYVFQMESGAAGTQHFQIYLGPQGRMYLRFMINEWVTFGCHPHIEMARRWKQAMLYC